MSAAEGADLEMKVAFVVGLVHSFRAVKEKLCLHKQIPRQVSETGPVAGM